MPDDPPPTVVPGNKNHPHTRDEEDDVISNAIGEFGKWQLLHTFLLSLFNVPCTWHIFAPTFHAADRETWCARTPAYRFVYIFVHTVLKRGVPCR
nr:unnamed protein product [Callosobruchus analis]